MPASTLRKQNWIDRLSPLVRQELLSAGQVRSYAVGETIVWQDRPSANVTLIVRGTAFAQLVGLTGKVHLLAILRAGAILNEATASNSQRLLSSVECRSDLDALILPSAGFESLRRAHPELDGAITAALARRYSMVLRIIEELALMPVEQRVVSKLATLAQEEAEDVALSEPTDIDVTQHELGLMTGISRQSINRILSRLTDQGLVQVGFKRIVVHPQLVRQAAHDYAEHRPY